MAEQSELNPPDRPKMSDIERLRHSAAHVLATAILRIWPEAQFAAGPPVENGFYYDVELPHRISPEDFPRIEEEMKKEMKANHVFERIELSRAEALEMAKTGKLAALSERGEASKFKLDIIQHIPEGEQITIYKNGDFTDLCAGPHVMRTGNIGAFKLTSVASAYYKGDEKNPQLQRIYGTAFKNKTEMEAYFTMLEEAKKRDHRKLGRELELFIFDDDVGPGLPLWLPNGTALIEEIEKLAKETEFAGGYDRVRTPHLARANMYLTSGHLPYYEESMFPPMQFFENRKEVDELESAVWSAKKAAVEAFERFFNAYRQKASEEEPWISDFWIRWLERGSDSWSDRFEMIRGDYLFAAPEKGEPTSEYDLEGVPFNPPEEVMRAIKWANSHDAILSRKKKLD